MQKTLKLIAISAENYQTLRELGKTADSFNDVLSRILKDFQKPKSQIGGS